MDESIDIEAGAGAVYAEELRAQKVEIQVAAGELGIDGELASASEVSLEVRGGNMEIGILGCLPYGAGVRHGYFFLLSWQVWRKNTISRENVQAEPWNLALIPIRERQR